MRNSDRWFDFWVSVFPETMRGDHFEWFAYMIYPSVTLRPHRMRAANDN